MTVCVIKYKLSENDVYRKGILVESLNPYTDITEQVIVDGSCNIVGPVYDFVRLEEEGCFKTSFHL